MIAGMRSAFARSGALRLAAQTARPATVARPLFVRCFADMKFTATHEWIKFDGGNGALGITDFAQGQLGEVVYCDLPEVGASIKGKETLCTLESVKAVGEVYAPADCEVTEVNDKLADEPSMVNSSPEDYGWLVKVKFTGDVGGLLDRAAYEKHVEAAAKEEE